LADEELRHHSEGDGDLGLFALFLRIIFAKSYLIEILLFLERYLRDKRTVWNTFTEPTFLSLSHIVINGEGSPPQEP
jgi:hypothetical protein